ncbi:MULTISPECIES: hypothetical protein [Brevibacillus]|nr:MULTISPECIES: hypothetical protein [Brevibacillus]
MIKEMQRAINQQLHIQFIYLGNNKKTSQRTYAHWRFLETD